MRAPRSSRALLRIATVTCVFTLVWMHALPLRAAERGFPLITVFPAEVHKAGPQTFDMAQGKDGLLYFGNLQGLLVYDGAWWRLIKLPDDQAAGAIATNAQGKLALGLVNDFGYLDHDRKGVAHYVSLLPLLPEAERDFGDVRSICSWDQTFFFVSASRLLQWDGAAVRVAYRAPQEDPLRGCQSTSSGILLRQKNSLSRIDPQSGKVTSLINEVVERIVIRGDGSTVLAIKDKGLFLFDAGASPALTPFAPEATAWLRDKTPAGSIILPDGRIVLATRQNGVAILSHEGELLQVIDDRSGLPDSVIMRARVDREGGLWLAMEGPIVRIDVDSSVSVFDRRSGLRGNVSDVIRHDGALFAASTHGLYRFEPSGVASAVEGVQVAWRLLSFDDQLLVAGNGGLLRLGKRGTIEKLFGFEEASDMSRSQTDPARVWVAHREGVSSIRFDNGAWKDEGLVKGSPEYASTAFERDGVLWSGSVYSGITRIEEPRGANRVRTFGSGEMSLAEVDGRIVVVDARGALLQPGIDSTLTPDARLGHVRAPGGFFAVAQDRTGDLWINSTPPRLFTRAANGSYSAEGKPLVSVAASDIQTVRASDDGQVWFCSDKGLFRYQRGDGKQRLNVQPAPLIRRVIAGENHILFGGGGTPDGEPDTLPHTFGRIRIEYAPVSFNPGVTFQYRLDPIDEQWSDWTSQTFIDYTTLEGNDYTFRVRSRGTSMVVSGESVFSFKVMPPWYRTPWAYGLAALLIAAIVTLVIRIRTSTLERQAKRLRETVTERTAELRETVHLLEDANGQLEALTLEDDLTGIANRRHFERALGAEWNRARRNQEPLALVLLDLDHFKDLNDHSGHPAGDECLRRIGAFLSDAVRRSGDVVARYGGEEFAILLPNTDAEGAINVAECLREGVEQLAIPYGVGSARRMTTSCGVAAVIPAMGSQSEELVGKADRALYAAKSSGRNCVRVADDGVSDRWMQSAATREG